MTATYELKDYPSDEDLDKLAKRVYKSAISARNRTELMYIPEGHEASHRAGQESDGMLSVTYTQKNGAETSHTVRIDEEGRWMGTPAQWKKLRDDLSWTLDWFSPFAGNDPVKLVRPIEEMSSASAAIWNASKGKAENIPNYRTATGPIETWKSVAGHAFRNAFWSPAPEIMQNQAFFAGLLANALTANQEALVEHRRTLKSIATQTQQALDALGNESGGFNANLSVVAAVATIVAGVLALPASGGASISAAGAGAATIMAGASAMPSGDKSAPKKNSMSADTVDGVLDNMIEAVHEANKDLDDEELRIMLTLHQYHERLQSPGDGKGLSKKHMLPRPAMVGEAEEVSKDPRVTIPELSPEPLVGTSTPGGRTTCHIRPSGLLHIRCPGANPVGSRVSLRLIA